MKLPNPLALFTSVFSTLRSGGFFAAFQGRIHAKKTLNRVIAATLLLILLAGTGTAVYLVQNNQDLRQQAAFFNLGGGQSKGGTVDTFTINGEVTNSITISLQDEAFRDSPSVIFANGANSKNNEEIILDIKNGNSKIVQENYSNLTVKEHKIPTGEYTLNVLNSVDGSTLYTTGLSLEENALVIVTRTPSNENPAGTFRYFEIPFDQVSPVRVFNLTDQPQEIYGGTLSLTFNPTRIQPGSVAETQWTTLDKTEFSLNSPYPKIHAQKVSVSNTPRHRLFFFLLGDSQDSRISLATIPLPTSSANDSFFISSPLESGDELLDSYVNNRSPLKHLYQYLEHTYFDKADKNYVLTGLDRQQSGFIKIKQMGNKYLVWSRLPTNQSVDLDNTIYTIFSVMARQDESWNSEILKYSTLLGWYVPSGDEQMGLISVRVLDTIPTPAAGQSEVLGVFQYKNSESGNFAFFASPATVEVSGDTYFLKKKVEARE